jgi:hypothetical protein
MGVAFFVKERGAGPTPLAKCKITILRSRWKKYRLDAISKRNPEDQLKTKDIIYTVLIRSGSFSTTRFF